MKIALCCIAQNENRYLKEYIDHYKKLEIDHIYIYDNNYIDGEDIQQLIDDLNYNDFVTVIDRKIDDKRNDGKIQTSSYVDCYYTYGHLYDYIMFCDVDEYFNIINLNFSNIKDYMNYMESHFEFDQLHIPMIIYDDNDQIFYDDKPLQERFTRICEKSIFHQHNFDHIVPFINLNIKSIVKTKLNVDCNTPHTFHSIDENNPLKTLDETGYHSYETWSSDICQYFNVCFKHYWSKSLEEFIFRRINKHNFNHVNFFNSKRTFDDEIEYYFTYNKKTPDKLHFIEFVKKYVIDKDNDH